MFKTNVVRRTLPARLAERLMMNFRKRQLPHGWHRNGDGTITVEFLLTIRS